MADKMYLGLRDLETGKIKKALPSSYLVTAQRDPETGKILQLIPDKTEAKHDGQLPDVNPKIAELIESRVKKA